ncbi:hypothetical protein ACN27G_07315 [Plantactinospora sp. WMMB334]|uniref:hypothetical protein n=1 Tax=Plantactinospora sp. WMMB334 TaxID=3404119 RepID=UPI003B9411F0
MEVFLSWSGIETHQLALLLRKWLPQVINELEPWVSSEDIQKGELWDRVLTEKLGGNQGIICVSRRNMHSAWLNFEAGALAKSVGQSAVRPLLLDITATELQGPLSRFQLTRADDRDEMRRLLHSLNRSCARPIRDDLLAETFGNAWPTYLDGVRQIVDVGAAGPEVEPRGVDDIVGEVLELVRDIHRSTVAGVGSVKPADDRLPRIDLGGQSRDG